MLLRSQSLFHRLFATCLVAGALCFVCASASEASVSQDSPQTMTLDGQLYQAGTTNALLDSSAQIVLQILDVGRTCVLYEEKQTVNTSTTGGSFNILLGSSPGSAKRTVNDPGNAMATIFQNKTAITGTNAAGQTCAGGSYTPTAGATRYLRLIVTPSSSGTADTLSPDMVLNSAPNAIVAQSVQGVEKSDLLQVNSSGSTSLTQANLEAAFTGSAYTNLQSILSGNFLTESGTSGAALPAYSTASPPTSPAAGSLWYDSTANAIKFYNGTSTQTLGSGSGTVTSVTSANADISVATTTSTPVLTLNSGTSANQILKLDAAAKIPAVDGSKLTNLTAGNLTGTVPVANGGTGTTSGSITGTGALTFTAGGTSNNVILMPAGSGNVGIGNSSPTAQLYVRSATPGVSSGTVTMTGTSGSSTVTLSATGTTITIGDYIVPSTSTSQARAVTSVSGTTIGIEPGQPLSADVTGETFTVYRPLVMALNNSTPKFTVQGFTGRIGVNTRYPMGAIDGNLGIANQSNIAVRGVLNPAHTLSGTYNDLGFQLAATGKIAAGVTNSGAQVGVQSAMLRNYGTTGDNGTLTTQRALDVAYGNLNSDGSATPTTTNAYGIFLQPYAITGTISNMYDVYIAGAPTGATLTNGHFGIYQADPGINNYFAGKFGIGVTPGYKLDVQGDINSSTVFRIGGTQICSSSGCTSSSDRTLKENIQPLDNSLANLLKIQGVSYDWKNKEKYGESQQIGLIAQDLEKIYPQVVVTDSKTGLKSVAYDHLVAPVIESIKVLYAKIITTDSHVQELQAENAMLKADGEAKTREIQSLKDRMDRLEAILKAR